MTTDEVLDAPTVHVRRRKRESDAYSLPKCSCTRQHSCPMHSRVPTPYELSKAGPVPRTRNGAPISSTAVTSRSRP